MEYIKIPYVKTEVSKIIFGTAVGSLMGEKGDFELLDAAWHRSRWPMCCVSEK